MLLEGGEPSVFEREDRLAAFGSEDILAVSTKDGLALQWPCTCHTLSWEWYDKRVSMHRWPSDHPDWRELLAGDDWSPEHDPS